MHSGLQIPTVHGKYTEINYLYVMFNFCINLGIQDDIQKSRNQKNQNIILIF